MKTLVPSFFALLLTASVSAPALAQEAAPMLGAAKILRTVPAREATQGVANDPRFLYAIENSTIGKYDRRTGQRVGLWSGDRRVFIHINSCETQGTELVCAMSNYPNVPMWSSVEWFDTKTMRHLRSHSFGPGRGSLTWIDWHDGSWWACFANYDGDGGEAPRDHRSTLLVRMDPHFVTQEQWLFPEDVLNSFGHHSASGGHWGQDGRLYVSGHDAPSLYVLALPAAGGRLLHVGTYDLPTRGQAFDWDVISSHHLWTIDRQKMTLVESSLPTP
ncbi:hypothetical protein [Gluconobacter sp. DsW_056]|uniref:hypothetical protein n=1 Tax=Gluconobacter sp. DsW_056 TaxID=1511209 RepID=UPI000A3767DE|nr:hypothetical protein [Gluconobacter sp. DsW_056]